MLAIGMAVVLVSVERALEVSALSTLLRTAL